VKWTRESLSHLKLEANKQRVPKDQVPGKSNLGKDSQEALGSGGDDGIVLHPTMPNTPNNRVASKISFFSWPSWRDSTTRRVTVQRPGQRRNRVAVEV
jgi:hypothetical protein